MNYGKIITHGGTFHADEVLACAIIRNLFGELPVERKFQVTDEEMEDPHVCVLDIGRVYDPSRGLFDHHQSSGLPACNVLVANAFIVDIELRELLVVKMLQYVSDVDCGVIVEEDDYGIPTLNSIVRNMNALEYGFDMALEMCEGIVRAYIFNARAAIAGRVRWEALTKDSGIAIQHDMEQIVGWKSLARRDGVYFLCCPNSRGGYQLVSRDSSEFPIPSSDLQTFRHKSGFLAVYATCEDAIADAIVFSDSITGD